MAILNKSDLAAEVSQESGLSTDDAKLTIEKLFELIARHLANGDEINVPGFGKFTVTDRAARQGRNPQTGETIQIAASQTPKFSPAGALKTALKRLSQNSWAARNGRHEGSYHSRFPRRGP
jgi:DNA-binding protein HU-beta